MKFKTNYYRVLSTPEPALKSLAGMQNMKHRIWLEKLCVVARILYTKQETENYARKVLQEQIEQALQGLTSEVAEICQLVGLPNICQKIYRKKRN